MKSYDGTSLAIASWKREKSLIGVRDTYTDRPTCTAERSVKDRCVRCPIDHDRLKSEIPNRFQNPVQNCCKFPRIFEILTQSGSRLEIFLTLLRFLGLGQFFLFSH